MDQLRYAFLVWLKFVAYGLYPSKLQWIGNKPKQWDDISLILILNHTSLFEFLLGVTLPFSFLREIAQRLIIPVAETTMERPVSRFIFTHLAPKTISLTRKRDDSWQTFLQNVEKNDICIFMPEGQMKRKNGLDKNGQPMTVKTGVYDLLLKYQEKKMLLVYSQGLHHILAPGERLPRICQKIEAKAEVIEVSQYLAKFAVEEKPWKKIAKDLEMRRNRYCD